MQYCLILATAIGTVTLERLTSSLTTFTLILETWRDHRAHCDHPHPTRTTFEESHLKNGMTDKWEGEAGHEMTKTTVNSALLLHQLTLRKYNLIYTFNFPWLLLFPTPKEWKSERDTTSFYFLDSVSLNLKFSFTDEYIKDLSARINKYITRLSRHM